MKYDDALKLLGLEKNKKYSDQEIKSICRKIMLKYHPDKRLKDDKNIVRKEYDDIIHAIEILKNGNNEDHNIVSCNTKVGNVDNIVIIEMHNFFKSNIPFFYDTELLRTVESFIDTTRIFDDFISLPMVKTPAQLVVIDVTAYEIFAEKTITKTIDVAVEGEIEHVNIVFKVSPTKMSEIFYSMGHKDFDESRGDIIVETNIISDDYWNYYPEKKTLIITKYIKYSKRNIIMALSNTAVILPCGYVLTYNLNISKEYKAAITEMYYIGKHPKYTDISIYLSHGASQAKLQNEIGSVPETKTTI